jgi:CheY-like chemotaxis protein
MSLRGNRRVNLDKTSVLIVDDDPQALAIMSSVVQGFGVRQQMRCETAREAVDLLTSRQPDLVFIDCSMPDMDGYDFVRWVRREAPAPLNMTPIIMLTGHAAQSRVEKSRDCGASFVIAKPITPSVVLDRVVWLGRDTRPFVECDAYAGPDRRIRNLGPPAGMEGRRSTDLSGEVGAVAGENLAQEDIDGMFKPMRVSI